jgi:hypothetical protein
VIKHLLAAAGILVGSAAYAQTTGSVFTLTGDYVKIGTSDYGTIGSKGNTAPGILYDNTGTRTFNSSYDYLTPGSPFEGFTVKYTNDAGTTVSKTNNNTGTVAVTGGILTNYSGIAFGGLTFDNRVVWTGSTSDFTLTNDVRFNNSDKVVDIKTTLATTVNMTNLYFGRFTDPDARAAAGDSSATTNTLGFAPISAKNVVFSEALVSKYALGLYTAAANSGAGVTMWTTDPATYYSGTNVGNGDNTIGLGFYLPTLAAGGSVTFEYAYIFGPSTLAAGATAVTAGAGGGTPGVVPGCTTGCSMPGVAPVAPVVPAAPTPVGAPYTTYVRGTPSVVYGVWTPFATVQTDARTNSGTNGVITRKLDGYDVRAVISRVAVTPVTNQNMSDSTVVKTNGTVYNEDTPRPNEQRLGNTSSSSASFSNAGFANAIKLRSFSPFTVDPVSKKDGAWVSPTASYYKTVGSMASGGTGAGYQWTVDNNTFGVAVNYAGGRSGGLNSSKIENESYDSTAYSLIRDNDLWVKTAVGLGSSKYNGTTALPIFALSNSAKFNQRTIYGDVTVYSADTYYDVRPLVGATVVNSSISGVSETGSTFLSTKPAAKSTATISPYVGLRYDFDKNFGVEGRVTQSRDFKTVGSIRATANTEIYDGVFLNAAVGVDKSSNLTGVVGTIGLKINF